jgi:hypothetical protein
MGRETFKADADLTEADRFRINEARAVLRSYGRNPQPDTPEPLSELGYEQRIARMKAMELAAGLWQSAPAEWATDQVIDTAHYLYEFIWEAKHA